MTSYVISAVVKIQWIETGHNKNEVLNDAADNLKEDIGTAFDAEFVIIDSIEVKVKKRRKK